MKVKQLPDDFRVEERTDCIPGNRGPFAFYRLDKVGWTTPDALALVRREWQIPPSRMSYGGLKDRHARTSQFLTIFHGPQRNLTRPGVEVRYLGQIDAAYDSARIRANRFLIAVRALTEAEAQAARAAVPEVERTGVPNYFDDQRFGSVDGPEGEFIGRLLVRGQFEAALKLALAGPYGYDDAGQRREKATLLNRWGDWATAREELPRGHARSLVDYLVHHPTDFRGAVVRLRPELRGLYLSAYQSHLWNRMLARWLRERVPESVCDIPLRLGPMPFPQAIPEALTETWRTAKLALPSARLHLAEGDANAPIYQAILAEEGLEMRDLQVRGVRELFFSKGERPMACFPEGMRADVGADDQNAGRSKLLLAFDLPRGSYATLVIKRLTSG